MDLEKSWEKALRQTEIIRARVQSLMTQSETQVPYILLSESSVNEGDTVVRKGIVVVDKPAIILPPHHPMFSGFEFEKEGTVSDNAFVSFLLVRGIHLPSLRYDNITSSLDIFEGKLSAAIKEFKKDLQEKENVHTGLIAAPEDCWQFSLLIFICSQIMKNTDQDMRHLIKEFKGRGPHGKKN